MPFAYPVALVALEPRATATFFFHLNPTMKKLRLAPFITALTLCTGALAQQPAAQQPPSPEQMRQIMQATMGAMVSVMGPMTEAVIDAQLNLAARPETATRIATFKRNLFDALVKQGFKEDQALQIVIATSPPSASPSTK